MKITKYPQSCFILEQAGTRIIIDPGKYVAEKYSATELPTVAAIFLTHKHPDHAFPPLVSKLAKGGEVPVFTNKETAEALGSDIQASIVHDGDMLSIGEFAVEVFARQHSLLPDDTLGPENTGYLVNDTFWHGGDTTDVAGITAKVAAVPIVGPDISPRDFFHMAKTLGAEQVVPMHYDYFPSDPYFYEALAKDLEMPFAVVPLQPGESLEI